MPNAEKDAAGVIAAALAEHQQSYESDDLPTEFHGYANAVLQALDAHGYRILPPADMCHNGHPFVPGESADHAPGESDPNWCNTCGEARILPPEGQR